MIQLEFEFERETKNKVRFKELSSGGEAIIGTLYISKAELNNNIPQKVYAVITTEDELTQGQNQGQE